MKRRNLESLPAPGASSEGWPFLPQQPSIPEGGALPSIGIVTPSLNSARTIERTLRSVLCQGYPQLEFHVVDGQSTDGALDVIDRYAGALDSATVEADAGQSCAINKGLQRCRSEIVAYLNADDYYLPGTLQKVGRFFRDHPGVHLVYGSCYVIDDDDDVVACWPGKKHAPLELLHQNYICQPASFWRRSIHDRVGYFDECLHYAMDYDFWIRASTRHVFYHLPVMLAVFQLGRDTKTSREPLAFLEESLRVVKRFLREEDGRPFADDEKRIIQSHFYYAAAHLLDRGDTAASRRQFLEALRERPASLKALRCALGVLDSCLGTNLFKRSERLARLKAQASPFSVP